MPTTPTTGANSEGRPPDRKQLRYLRKLALRAGQSFATPRSIDEASDEIERLLAVRDTGTPIAEIEATHAARRARLRAPSSARLTRTRRA